MADKPFLKLLAQLKREKQLNVEQANEMSQDSFDLNFRELVKERMAVVKQANLKDIFKDINKVYHKLITNPSTLDNYFTADVRKPISVRFGIDSREHKLAKELVRLDYEVKGKLLKDAKTKVFQKNQNTIQTDSKFIIDLIRDNVHSEDSLRVAVALLIASGSRPIELFARSEYKKLDNGWVTQSNIAKKKGESVSVKKPLIYLSADQFIEALTKLRESLKGRFKNIVSPKTGQLSSSINTAANNVAKKIFEGKQDFTLYTARKLYANLSYDLYGKNKKTIVGDSPNLQVWISSVLGHQEGSLSTSANYSHVSLAPDNTTPDELKRKQDLIETKIEELETRMDDASISQAPATPEPLPNITVDMSKYGKYRSKIKASYLSNNKPLGAAMERILKGTVPRAYVRQFMRTDAKTL